MEFKADAFFANALKKQSTKGLFREWGPLRNPSEVDFYSNDYLGLGINPTLNKRIARQFQEMNIPLGSSGSRLVSGHSELQENFESSCCRYFHSKAAIFFPNGYMANLALLSCIATRHDTIIYDEQAHVSIKDGIRLSQAARFSFRHNQPADLDKKLAKAKGNLFVVVEAIYSMDGDVCPLLEILQICEKYGAHLIVDEAHSTGVLGQMGQGLCVESQLHDRIWARIYTFGKALGASGAILALQADAKKYLINFSHPLIYSTAPLPIQILLCSEQLSKLSESKDQIAQLQDNIAYWNGKKIESEGRISKNLSSPVQYILVPGNAPAKALGKYLQQSGFQIKAMLSPTVSEGKERLRVSLHSYNLPSEIDQLFAGIVDFENNFGITI
jgi:8-amino-7-oxononanoate synthase